MKAALSSPSIEHAQVVASAAMSQLLAQVPALVPDVSGDIRTHYIEPANKLAQVLSGVQSSRYLEFPVPRAHFQVQVAIGALRIYLMRQAGPLYNQAKTRNSVPWLYRAVWMRALFYRLGTLYPCLFTGEKMLWESYLHRGPQSGARHGGYGKDSLFGQTEDDSTLLDWMLALHSGAMSIRGIPLETLPIVYEAWSSPNPGQRTLSSCVAESFNSLVNQYARLFPGIEELLGPVFSEQTRQFNQSYAEREVRAVVHPTPEPQSPAPVGTGSTAGGGEEQSIQGVIDLLCGNGTWTVNQKGARVHKTPSGVALVVPAIYEDIAIHLKSRVADVQAVLVERMQEPVACQYCFTTRRGGKNHRQLPVNLLHLKKQYWLPAWDRLPVNADILTYEKKTA